MGYNVIRTFEKLYIYICIAVYSYGGRGLSTYNIYVCVNADLSVIIMNDSGMVNVYIYIQAKRGKGG